jgi:thioredoxin-like negative regulator of GroEL
MEKELESTVTIVRIDADKNPTLCQALKVENLPTVKIYKNKKMTWDNIGFVEETTLREKIKGL